MHLKASRFKRQEIKSMKKKTIPIPIVILKTNTGYNAFSPFIDGCIATAKTVDTVIKRIKEAIEFHLEGEFLLQHRKKSVQASLRHAFEDYGTDALYGSINVVSN
jgi:predicted RNase H-like HicB family nuclease